ncbi:hypothetical protein LSCM1_04372 [Leishmania martiniquensis]|uniref:Uncharacterized protein n=1 Tax=Leishmania martiniquensis TaxID=1580590 RepID=A0A836G2D5_9TRYP|nr:hypothetical protein LSCM1_04372 [Leishmania martiniquensis]
MDSKDAGATLAGIGSSTGAAYPAEAQPLKAAADGDDAHSAPDSTLAAWGTLQNGEAGACLADVFIAGKGAGGGAATSDDESDADTDAIGSEDEDIPEEEEQEGSEIVGEDADEEYEYEPAVTVAAATGTSSSAPLKPVMITIGTRQYKLSAFVKNRGLSYVPGKLKSNPKSTLEACVTNAPHSILDCQKLHLSNRGVLVGDRFIRLNMLVDNPGKEALLRNPGKSLKMRICRKDVEPQKGETHSPVTCSFLHLLPDIVFIGIPGLRTAYFEAELRHNLAFTKLKEEPWETQCGTWCRGTRSHVVTTCRYLHYNRGDNYTERPTPPHRPLAAIPDLTPSRPPQATDSRKRGRGRGCGGRGRGGRGQGSCRGRGSYRGHGRGGRGAAAIPLPRAFQPGHLAPFQASAPRAMSATTEGSGVAQHTKLPPDAVAEACWMTNDENRGSAIDGWLLNVLIVLLGVSSFLLAISLRRNSEPAAAAP